MCAVVDEVSNGLVSKTNRAKAIDLHKSQGQLGKVSDIHDLQLKIVRALYTLVYSGRMSPSCDSHSSFRSR
jgi:hypothetical protein